MEAWQKGLVLARKQHSAGAPGMREKRIRILDHMVRGRMKTGNMEGIRSLL